MRGLQSQSIIVHELTNSMEEQVQCEDCHRAWILPQLALSTQGLRGEDGDCEGPDSLWRIACEIVE